MAVALVGSVGTVATSTTAVCAGAYGQTTTAGNLLVAVACGTGLTAANWSCTQTSGTTGWTALFTAVDSNPAGTDHCGIQYWYKTAAGGDAAPSFTFGVSGVINTDVVILELSGANTTTPLDATAGTGIYQSGAAGISFPTVTLTTAGNVAAAGEFGISCFNQDTQLSNVQTWTELGSGWTNAYKTGAVSQDQHIVVNYQANPTSGATLSDSGHFSSGAGVVMTGALAVIAVAAGASPTPAQAAGTGVPPAPVGSVGLNMTIQGV